VWAPVGLQDTPQLCSIGPYRKHWPQCHWASPMTRWVISARAIQAPDGRLSAMPPIATDVAAMQRMTPCAIRDHQPISLGAKNKDRQ
jgi:hypothetical protein